MPKKRPQNRWRRLSTEATHPRSERLDRLGVEGIVALMQSEDRAVLRALRGARPEIIRAAKLFRDTYLAGNDCFLFGAGTSGRLAVLEAAEIPPTFGTDPRRVRAAIAGGRGAIFRAREGGAEDRVADGALAAQKAREGDLVIGVSASSVTPFVRGALQRARQHGARTVLVTASDAPGVSKIADVVIRLHVGPEVLAGSTRLKAGTATKLALNQITTAALASAGKAFGPWMVDLRAGSAKLKDRARRIVAAVAGVKEAAAKRLLSRAAGDVKSAIVMGRTGAAYEEARSRLARAGGDLRAALSGEPAARRHQ